MKKRLLSILLTAALAVGMLAGCASEAPAAETTKPTEAVPAPTQAPVATEPPEAAVPPVEKNGDIIILYTSDVHCGIDQGFGYGGIAQMRNALENQGYTTLLVDNGDAVQGDVIATVTKGEAIIELMNSAHYDVAIPGNHEFDYGMENFLQLTEKADFPYISANFRHEGEPVFSPYVIREAAGKKIAFVGVTTPWTFTSSSPKYFQNEQGEFIYDFCRDETGEALYEAVQKAVDDARAEGAQYVLVMGHVGNEEGCAPWTYADIISHTEGIDVFLDGHSHDTEQVVMQNKNGDNVIRSACGTKLASVGWVKIPAEGEIQANLYTWNNDVAITKLFGMSNDVVDAVTAAKANLDGSLSEVVAKTAVELTINDPVAVDDKGLPIRMVRRSETNMGDLVADAYREQCDADIGLSNGGGVRTNLKAGDITLGGILKVQPFNNELCMVTATGQQILDALEWGAQSVPNETGKFLQVSGLTYEIHSYIPTSCTADENGIFSGVSGTRRVQNVCVAGQPIDPNATYTVAATAYILMDCGDGYSMFQGCEGHYVGKLDNQALIDYIRETLCGVVGSGYEDPCGDGRIVIFDAPPTT